jgi:hypothetical protein
MIDPFELVRAEEMLRGYHARWRAEEYEVVSVEKEFEVPLRNPRTGGRSQIFNRAGKFDAIARKGGRTFVIEHKTSSEDISPGSKYWVRRRMDSQISMYIRGAEDVASWHVDGVVYDVLGKPQQRPLKKNAKNKADETPEEFRLRVREAIAKEPESYYQRGQVVRLESDLDEFDQDTWQLARLIREGELTKRFPRNPDACERYGRTCAFFGVCAGEALLDDTTKFRKKDGAHSELDTVSERQLITNSRLVTFRRCQREHKYSYLDGYESVDQAAALRLGAIVHKGLEAWWGALIEGSADAGADRLELAIKAMRAAANEEPMPPITIQVTKEMAEGLKGVANGNASVKELGF